MPYRISLIGSGNVAWHFAKAFDKAGHKIAQVYSRNLATAKELAQPYLADVTDDIQQLSDDVDVLLVCVNDDEIAHIATQLKHHKCLIVHTGGAVSIDALANTSPYYGVLYPVQSLTAGREINFYEVPLCIEGNGKVAEAQLKALADTISNRTYFVDTEQRKYLHLAAVFANNFTNALYQTAQEILNRHGLDFDLLRPLIKETAAKVQTLSPQAAQTGPAKRHDESTLEKHLQLLPAGSEERKIYELITEVLSNRQ